MIKFIQFQINYFNHKLFLISSLFFFVFCVFNNKTTTTTTKLIASFKALNIISTPFWLTVIFQVTNKKKSSESLVEIVNKKYLKMPQTKSVIDSNKLHS